MPFVSNKGNMLTLMLAIAFNLGEAAITPSHKDLLNALNTAEKIWLGLRSYYWFHDRKRHNCVYIEKEHLEYDEYRYKQHYIEDGKTKTQDFSAVLSSEEGQYPKISVTLQPGVEKVEYTVRSWRSNEKCGVLIFMDNNWNMQCELYAWDKYVKEIGTWSKYACEEEYDRLCARKYDGNAYECRRAMPEPSTPPPPGCR